MAEVDFAVSGEGPPILLVPGSYSTKSAWKGVIAALPQRYTFATMSLPGYGASGDDRTPDDCAIERQVEAVARVARTLGGPVHLVGHSMGGAVALAAAVMGALSLSRLTLFEANPFGMLPPGEGRARIEALAVRFFAAIDAGEADAARHVIDYWGGAGTLAAMPQAFREACVGWAAVNRLDFLGVMGFRPGPESLAQVQVPVRLVAGAESVPEMVLMTGLLRAGLADVTAVEIDGAGHFLITTHPNACAAEIAANAVPS